MKEKFAKDSDGYNPGLDNLMSKFQDEMKKRNSVDHLDVDGDDDVINENIMRAIQDQFRDFAKGSMDNSAGFPESTKKET